MSLALGAGFLAVALLVALPAEVDGVVFWLGQINLILLVFNLLPALPLDGGRVLRAALWARTGNFVTATRTSARLGRLFGQLLIGWGLLVAILGGAIGGLWLAFIGWFLLMAAEGEAGMAEARTALSGLRVRDVMVRDPVTARPDMTLKTFMEDVFMAHRHTSYPVTEDGGALGLVSFRRVADIPQDQWDRKTVRDCMFPLQDTVIVAEDAELADVAPELAQNEPRRALVVDRGRLVGLVSITDAARLLEAFAGSGARGGRGMLGRSRRD